MPNVERLPYTEHHILVGGPFHGQCWTIRELVQLGPQLDSYGMYHEVATGSTSGKLARVWRYLYN